MIIFRTIGILVLTLYPILGLCQESGTGGTAEETPSAPQASVKHTLSQITIKVKDAGTEVRLNGELLGKTPLGGPWTVKPGQHVFSFTAKNKQSGEIKLSVKAGEKRVLEWPEPATDAGNGDSGLNWAPWSLSDVGIGVAIGGAAAVALGSYFGSQAVELADEAGRMITTETYRVDFERLTEQSSDAALKANLAYGVGAAALMSGLVMAVFGDGGIMSMSGDEDEAVIIIGGSF